MTTIFFERAGELCINILRRGGGICKESQNVTDVRAFNPPFLQLDKESNQTLRHHLTRPGIQNPTLKCLYVLGQGEKKLLKPQQKTTTAAPH